ncbi:hypothetical protein J3R30DRAFT_3277483 [Lentinula aciculospora]|uniref:Protein kinase domain-containing protein n=1 Tax=Lentinula aciculospora TaxID=153920 RepID=A0A9W9AUC2_9AGAR|nr:hypothetical protein J3R30DRAFT_3277483 [Lentinula aciculospora]
MSSSAKDRPRRHSVATCTPTKEGKDADTVPVPAEQTQNWDITRKRVAQAASSILGTSALIAHEVLLTSVDLFELAPVPGLQAAARTLLKIWDCLQQVDSNRLQCLRLTEHCADILLSVRQEVYEAGDEVEDELRLPFDKLTESFNDVHALLVKQAGRPFLKRYLKRDEISKQLHHCDVGLQEALGMFSISIQIRILKQVQLAEARRQHDTQELLRSVANLSHLSQHGYPAQPEPPSYSTSVTPAEFEPETPKVSQVLPTLLSLTRHQAALDAKSDYADLRGVMRAALSKGSDVEIIKVLGVGLRKAGLGMAEAIKTLQRAHEAILERERWEDLHACQQHPEQGDMVTGTGAKPMQSKTLSSSSTSTAATTTNDSVCSGSGSGSGGVSQSSGKDTLDKEFIESGIDALRRMKDPARLLPSWTITRYEIDREEKIGVGFFSDVYKGTWRPPSVPSAPSYPYSAVTSPDTSPSLSSSRIVAIKVLAETTPRSLFLRETAIWKKLSHPNVLELYGASSASGDPPWFFVSPYMRNGSLAEYLRKISTENIPKGWDLLRFMHEIAKGMEYLHSQGVLHGDFKASNVLVDEDIHCVISDFGQSEMRSEAYRISGTAPPHGTLRWQAPEIFAGSSQLTVEMDVYAFAVCCTEVLSLGRMPWPLYDDIQVQNHIMANQRPDVPPTCFTTPDLIDLIHSCWATNPLNRPLFSKVATDLKSLREKLVVSLAVDGGDIIDLDLRSPQPQEQHELTNQLQHPRSIRSPDMHPIQLPLRDPPADSQIIKTVNSSPQPSSPTSSLFTSTLSELQSEEGHSSNRNERVPAEEVASGNTKVNNFDGYDSPPPANDSIAEARDERRYRLLLAHEFHPSLTLPLWSPAPVALGAVGYLSKPRGEFVTLFNAFHPQNSAIALVKGLPSVHGYGKFYTGSHRQDKRNAAQRGLDVIAGLFPFKTRGGNVFVSRRYSYPLRAGHKTAHLCTETTMYRYVENLDAPKKWFKANVDTMLEAFGSQHQIQKEDLFLVIGTLDTPEYALFVSHNHPDGQVHFNVFNSSRARQPWGTFSTDTETPYEFGGPSYHEPVSGRPLSANKISSQGICPWQTVLIARLRFKPDVSEPTSL